MAHYNSLYEYENIDDLSYCDHSKNSYERLPMNVLS